MTTLAHPLSADLPPHTAVGANLRQAWKTAESHCIKCGFCLPACPTYRETGVEAASPRGRLDLMYGVAQGHLGLEDIRAPLSLCLGCLACETACPSGIRYHDMFDAARVDLAAGRSGLGVRCLTGFLLDTVLTSQRWLKAITWALVFYQRSGLQSLLRFTRALKLLAPALARRERQTPPVSPPVAWRPLVREWVEEGPATTPAESPGGKAVALLTGCVMDAAFGAVHAATVKVLHANGCAVHLPPGQTCCGALHLHAGDKEGAQALARKNIAAFEALGTLPVIVNAAGCGALLKDYGELLADDAAWSERARKLERRIKDVSEYLAGLDLVAPTHPVPLRVAYDDACHLVHGQKIREQPRQLLRNIPGLELVPLVESDWCCGSAGSYSLVHPRMSAQVLARKMARIAASGAQVVATGNPGCLWQLRLGAREHGLHIRVVHPVELLAEAYG